MPTAREILDQNADLIEHDLQARCPSDVDAHLMRAVGLVAAQVNLMLDGLAYESGHSDDYVRMVVVMTDHLLGGIDMLGGLDVVRGSLAHGIYSKAAPVSEKLLNDMREPRP